MFAKCHFKQALVSTCLQYESFENTAGKGQIARSEQFLLFPQCFSTLLENFPPFSLNLKWSSAKSFSLEESKICRLGKGNSLPNHKIVDWSNLKAFANDEIYVTENLKFVVGWVENVMGKGENAGYHNVFKLLFLQGC